MHVKNAKLSSKIYIGKQLFSSSSPSTFISSLNVEDFNIFSICASPSGYFQILKYCIKNVSCSKLDIAF